MTITKKLGLGLAGAALVLTGGLGAAAVANADTTTPAQSQVQARDGSGYGAQNGARQNGAQYQYGVQNQKGTQNRAQDGTECGVQNRAQDGTGNGAQNGSGYGAQALADDLAEKLGVSADAVRQALVDHHAANPGDRGRDLSDAEQAARHAEHAAALAEALGVDAADVQAALDGYQAERR